LFYYSNIKHHYYSIIPELILILGDQCVSLVSIQIYVFIVAAECNVVAVAAHVATLDETGVVQVADGLPFGQVLEVQPFVVALDQGVLQNVQAVGHAFGFDDLVAQDVARVHDDDSGVQRAHTNVVVEFSLTNLFNHTFHQDFFGNQIRREFLHFQSFVVSALR